MAKRAKGENKSAAIRAFVKDNPSAKAKEVSEGLAKTGIKISPQYVSTILSNDRKKAGQPAKRRVGGQKKGGRPAGGDVYANLVQAKKLVDQFGSVDKARAALDALSRILG